MWSRSVRALTEKTLTRRVYSSFCNRHLLLASSSTVLRRRPLPTAATGRRFLSGQTDSNHVSTYMKNVVGIDKKLHSGILKALQIVYGKDISIANLQDFGPAGIQDLAASVAVELAKGGKFSKKRPRRSIHFTIPHHRTEFDLVWKEGESLLDVANGVGGDLIGEYMEGTCGGQMSCCSCHIYLDQMTFDALPPACEAELDMLELAYEPAETSRLGCQVRLQKELLKAEHEITITIPADVNNVWN